MDWNFLALFPCDVCGADADFLVDDIFSSNATLICRQCEEAFDDAPV